MGVAEGRFYPLVAHPLLNHEDVYTRVDHACSPGVAAGMEHEILVILQAHPSFVRSHHDLRFRSEEHTSELQSPMRLSNAVFCSKKKKALDRVLHFIILLQTRIT